MIAIIPKEFLEFNPHVSGSNKKGQNYYIMSCHRGQWQYDLNFHEGTLKEWPKIISIDDQIYKRKSVQSGFYLEDHGGFYRRETETEVIDIWVPYATQEMIEEQKEELSNVKN